MQSLGMYSNLSCYQLKIHCYIHEMIYVNLKVTTKQKFIVNTQKKMRKKCKHQSSNHKAGEKEKKKPRRTTNTSRKQQNENTYLPINNDFICKWTKLSNQKTQSG